MNLIDRYVTDIGRRLPKRQRDAVQAELRAAIDDALDARGATSSSENDVVDVLKEIGPPERVAAEYYPAGEYLIGPEFYPTFRRVLSVTLSAILLLSVIGFFIGVGTQGIDANAGGELMEWIGNALRWMMITTAGIVLAFVIIQRVGAQIPRNAKVWDPRTLPLYSDRDLVSRAESAVGIAVAGIAMIVVYEIATSLRSDLPVKVQPLLAQLIDLNLIQLNIALLLYVIVYAQLLIQGAWHRYTRALRFIADTLALVVVVRAVITIVNGRSTMLAAGLPAQMVTWLIMSAIATAIVAAVLLVWHHAPALASRRRSHQ